MRRFIRSCLIASGLAGVWWAYTCYGSLPGQVPIHFGAGGRADNWASRDTALLLSGGFHVLFTLTFLFMGRLLFWMPVRLVNFPNREYWLDPARRQEHLPLISSWFHAFGILLNICFLAVGFVVYPVQAGREARLDEGVFLLIIGATLALTGLWVFLLYRRFQDRPGSGGKG